MNGKVMLGMMMVLLMITCNGQAATFSLSSPGQIGNTLTVAPGANFTVSVGMDAQEIGNTFEVFLGFDVSDQTVPGLAGSPTVNRLILVDSLTNVANGINIDFPVYRSAKTATGREENNSNLGGRPYGIKVVGARYTSIVSGQNALFTAQFQNNMAAGESYYIVISDAAAGNSYTTGWKYGASTSRGSDILQVNSVFSRVPGDANGDRKVDVGDLGILAANYGGIDKNWNQGDFNEDGKVDVGDLGILAANYGTNVSKAVDFSADYAKVFGEIEAGDDEFAKESTLITGLPCPIVGMVLVLMLMLLAGWREP